MKPRILFVLISLILFSSTNVQSHVQILQPVTMIRKVFRFNVLSNTSILERNRDGNQKSKQIEYSYYKGISPDSQELKLVLNYLKNEIGQRFNHLKIIKYEKEINKNTIYRLTCETQLHKSQANPIKYQLIVQQSYNNQFSIKKPGFVEKSEPQYTYALNSYNAISKLNSASDPFIIPVVTELQLQEMKEQMLQRAIKFLIKKVSITDSFKVVLVNKIRYALRIVVSLENENQLFEALISYIYVKGNKSSAEMQLLQWKELNDISDVDPDAFVRYYNQDMEDSNKFVQRAIKKAFEKQKTVSSYEKLLKVQKKFTFDGVYYRILLLSLQNTKIQVIIFWIPENDYLQIYRYEILDNLYDASKQRTVEKIPFSNKQLNIVKNRLANFSDMLEGSVITFIAELETSSAKLWRLVFFSFNGKIQIIVSIDKETSESVIIRWEKLDDGYVTFSNDDYAKDGNFKKLQQVGQNYIKFKLQQEYKSNNFQLKTIAGVGKYFKFIFEKPFPFILTVEQSEDKRISIRGMDRIQIVSTSQYYNDRLFSGYTSYNPKSIKYDAYYKEFNKMALANSNILKQTNHQIKAVFKKLTSSLVSYKIIYQLNNQKLYIGTFQRHNYLNQAVINFEQYERLIQQGDYRWKCSSNLQSGQCSKCQSGSYILTVGRCYPKKIGCNFQISNSCIVCYPGFHRIRGGCSNILQNIQTQSLKEKPLQRSQSQNACLKFQHQICVNCAYRYYVHNGFCKKIEDSCMKYDRKTGACITCYERYYLTIEGCKQKDPLCKQMNQQNKCIECFEPFSLKQDSCVDRQKNQ